MGELEDAAERFLSMCDGNVVSRSSFISGANYQAEKMYSEEEVLDIVYSYRRWGHHGKEDEFFIDVWFEQFKKK
jgi:hypothetical protein